MMEKLMNACVDRRVDGSLFSHVSWRSHLGALGDVSMSLDAYKYRLPKLLPQDITHDASIACTRPQHCSSVVV